MCWPSFGVDIGHQGGVRVREIIFRFIVCCAIHAGVLSLHVVRCMRADGQSEGLPSGIMVSLRVGWGATSFLVSSSRRDQSSTWFLFQGATEARFGFSFTARPRFAFASMLFWIPFFTALDPNSSRLCSSIPCKASFWKCGSDIVQKCGSEMNSLRFKVSPSS